MRLLVCVAAAAVMAGGCSTLLTKSTAAAERSMGKRWLEANGKTAMPISDAGEAKVCKNMPVMGSNMPKRVCSTKAEWDKFEAAARDEMDESSRMRQGMGTATEGERIP